MFQLRFLAVVLVFGVGCNKTQKETTPEQLPILVQDEIPDAGPDRSTKPESKVAAAAGEYPPKVGVAPCDEYIAKMSVCIDEKMSPVVGDAIRSAFAKSIEAWSKLEGPALEALATGCQTALGAARSAYRDMGCEF